MANNNAPYGLKPVGMNGEPWYGQGRMVNFLSSYGSAVYLGDPVVPTGATDAFGVPVVTLATAGASNTIAGAFLGNCNGPAGSGVTLLQSSSIYRVASVASYAFITDDPNQLFSIQEDSNGGAIAAANAGYANGNLVAGSGGSTSTGLSSWQLQSSSVGASNSTYQVRVIGLDRGPDNAIGNYARWIVRLNLSALWAAAGY
jgi:hypothetical protein